MIYAFYMYFSRWQTNIEQDTLETIYPDGCQDVILKVDSFGEVAIFTSPIDYIPRQVRLQKDTTLIGYRLPPGCTISHKLLENFSHKVVELEDDIATYIDSQKQTIKMIEVIAASNNLSQAAKNIGVSPRTLQRRLQEKGLPTYSFWRSLNRARKAVDLINKETRMLDIAVSLGYSDHAHMTREVVRWFGLSPSEVRNSEVFSAITQSGLGNWTGEQISTR